MAALSGMCSVFLKLPEEEGNAIRCNQYIDAAVERIKSFNLNLDGRVVGNLAKVREGSFPGYRHIYVIYFKQDDPLTRKAIVREIEAFIFEVRRLGGSASDITGSHQKGV